MIGAVLGVKLIQFTFPNVGKGARLSVGVHHGALAEGLATFMVVMVSATIKKKEMKSFFMKTWITSIWKNTIHILSSDITGGIMNPASVSLSTQARLMSDTNKLLEFFFDGQPGGERPHLNFIYGAYCKPKPFTSLSFPDLEKKDGDNVYLVHLRLF